MDTPWPALVRRLRFISNLKQTDLADLLGVEQGTVSRWERATYVPDIPVQRRIRDMLHRLEPAIPVAGSGLVLFTAGLSQTPPAIDTSQCELTVVTKDEMVA